MYDTRVFYFWEDIFMKNDQTLFSIGEIAKAIGVTRRIILNYEERGLIKPDMRENATGNRYYTIDTFTQLRSIRSMQNLGLSLDEIKIYFDDSSDLLPLIHRLEKLRDELNINIEKLYERSKSTSEQIKTITLEKQNVYKKIYHSETVAERTILLRNTALEAMRSYGTDITRRMYFTEYKIGSPSDISFYVSVPPESKGDFVETMPTLKGICIYHHGAYEKLHDVAQRLLTYAKENNLIPLGTIRHTYLEGPPQHKNPENFITRIFLPIKNI